MSGAPGTGTRFHRRLDRPPLTAKAYLGGGHQAPPPLLLVILKGPDPTSYGAEKVPIESGDPVTGTPFLSKFTETLFHVTDVNTRVQLPLGQPLGLGAGGTGRFAVKLMLPPDEVIVPGGPLWLGVWVGCPGATFPPLLWQT